jgi:tRNA threonylcarbamoyladenosine biosynthesis protein TsaB
MRVLGIETATPVCSVALADSDRVVAEYTLDVGVQHARRVLPMVQRVLEDAGMGPSDLDGVGVSAGPGSFTGLRIGMSSAKGLCLASGLSLLSVPTLEALALRVAVGGMATCSMLDARRGEVYAGVYQLDGKRLACLVPDAVLGVGDLLGRLSRPVLFVGEGAVVYRDRILDVLEGEAHFVSGALNRPGAASVALLGIRRLMAGEVEDLSKAEPSYLRRSQAEWVREERLRELKIEN